ncbi:MAG: immunoglobulin domain-containing protein [Planctomycetes bacterium]|nr:immunoglobulin domain-containing protein [Planctomycetota bacterium]
MLLRLIGRRTNPASFVRRGMPSWLFAALVLVLTLFTPGAATAQCAPRWLTGIGNPGTDGTVTALAVLPDGDLIVGGTFSTAGDIAANRIARYHPTSTNTGTWSALGEGVDDTVAALAVLPDGDVIVGGAFSQAGGIAASMVARFHPTSATTGTWSAMGSGIGTGFGNGVAALAVLPDGDVVAAGRFTVAGGLAVNNIARYRPTSPTAGTWSNMSGGLRSQGGMVYTVAVLPDGDLVAGGDFYVAGTVQVSRVARYHPTSPTIGTWYAMGYVNDTPFRMLTLPDGDVIVGGVFTSTVGGLPVNHIARYHPTSVSTGTWSALGSGTDHWVTRLALLADGDVIVGGLFNSAGGVPATRIARYHAASPTTGDWFPLVTGLDSAAEAFAVLPDGDLIAGGFFTAIGGASARSIARYSWGSAISLNEHPSDSAVCVGEDLEIHVVAIGSDPITYRWRRDGHTLSDQAGHIAGATTPSLNIINPVPADSGEYDCVVTNQCGTVVSNPGTVTIVPCGTVVYVNGSAPGGGDGSSWDAAFNTLQSALDWAKTHPSLREIWVARGTYANGARGAFVLPCGVGVLGGFAGTESTSDQRDWVLNPTVLAGDGISAPVVLIENCAMPATLSGVTVRGGQTPPFSENGGAGVRVHDSTLTISDCVISGNIAGVASPGGGGVYAWRSVLRLERCELRGNSTDSGGSSYYDPPSSGAALNSVDSDITVLECVFRDNTTGRGGDGYCEPNQTSLPGGDGGSGAGIAIRNGSATIVNCLFVGNSVGGGGTGAGPCFNNNYRAPDGSPGRGGGIYNAGSDINIVNCTFAYNSGGAIGGYGSGLILSNSILWYNDGSQQFTFSSGTPTVGYSCIQNWTGSYGGVGVIASNPLFDGAGGYGLSAASPCIDAGNNTAVPAGVLADLAGDSRFFNVLAAPDTGVPGGAGGASIVDMGAYEHGGPCPGDFNGDGGVDGSDVGAFFIDWELGASAADVNGDGGVDGGDVQFFFQAWEAGC